MIVFIFAFVVTVGSTVELVYDVVRGIFVSL